MSLLVLDDESKRNAIIEGIKSGLSLEDVCMKVGLTRSTVLQYRRANPKFDAAIVQAAKAGRGRIRKTVFDGLPPYKDRELQARIINDVLRGGSCREDDLERIAKKHGFRLSQIWLWRRLDDQWRYDFESALKSVRDPKLLHGLLETLEVHKCKCVDCRALRYPPARRAEYVLLVNPSSNNGEA